MSRRFDFRKLTLIRMKLREVHTGNERVDKVVHALTNGRAASAMTAYEQFIGISNVKAAQNRVAEVGLDGFGFIWVMYVNVVLKISEQL